MSTQAAGHRTLVPRLLQVLRAEGRGDILVVCGGVVPPQDHELLQAAGVAAIFGPGSKILEAASHVLELIASRRAA